MPLQRVITDFGADASFTEAAEKIKEHYGVSVSLSAISSITEHHAYRIRKDIKLNKKPNKYPIATDHVIAETDGSMVPIVTINNDLNVDKRKTRRTEWCEARLALARKKDSKSPTYAALIGSVDEAGKQLANVVAAEGSHKKTRIHGVGDGAPWIADQFDKQFGSNADYIIDFYHLSNYLYEAALCCDEKDPHGWLRAQQTVMKKENGYDIVLQKLEAHINDSEQKEHVCAAIKCHQYIEKRTKHFNYKKALDEGLPIGSGEIESGHRSIIQKRLKLPGAWWLKTNANNMLALRTVRANGDWNACWPNKYLVELAN